MKPNTYLLFLVFFALLFSNCSVTDRTMQPPNYHIEFYKADFEYSQQLSAEATVVRILGIDWSRLFNWNGASISNSSDASSAGIPISIGTTVPIDPIVGIISTAIPVFGDKVKAGSVLMLCTL